MKSIYANPFAQSRIFKEISEEISTQVKPIMQDNVLVGYLAFTRLEKASADSFNYRLSIMDENLNDIGKVNFRQGILDLQTVSFEQHVLCLGYIQASLASIETIRTQRGYNKVLDAANSSHLLLQFVDLVRTIPHKNGSVKINVFPAKEGHMMVAEYDRKEKYTRFSIEALN